jgi:TetR/AcrR family transcriptional regulator, regulator of cefoperazone and chloramphenicol sensitivity
MPSAALNSRRRHRRPSARRSDPTPDKLIDAAGRVFAERGYYATTVREICNRAGANVAAVNYHFGDKLGLYTEVLRQSIRAAKVEALGNLLEQELAPEEMLRAFIKLRLQSAFRADLPDWHMRLLVHELAQPTPALSKVINEVSRPIYERVLQVVGEITGLPPQDEKNRLCVHSVMGQVLFYVLQKPLLSRLWPDLKTTPEKIDSIADHIVEFSLAYLRQQHCRKSMEKKSTKERNHEHSANIRG